MHMPYHSTHAQCGPKRLVLTRYPYSIIFAAKHLLRWNINIPRIIRNSLRAQFYVTNYDHTPYNFTSRLAHIKTCGSRKNCHVKVSELTSKIHSYLRRQKTSWVDRRSRSEINFRSLLDVSMTRWANSLLNYWIRGSTATWHHEEIFEGKHFAQRNSHYCCYFRKLTTCERNGWA